MAYYRITRLKVLNPREVLTIAEDMRDIIQSLGADFIDIAEDDDGNMMVVARYPDRSKMEAATAVAQDTFGKMVTRGAVVGSSIDQWDGNVFASF